MSLQQACNIVIDLHQRCQKANIKTFTWCRAHWLMALQHEWEACELCVLDLEQVGIARQHRSMLETLHDSACQQVVKVNAKAWGTKK